MYSCTTNLDRYSLSAFCYEYLNDKDGFVITVDS